MIAGFSYIPCNCLYVKSREETQPPELFALLLLIVHGPIVKLNYLYFTIDIFFCVRGTSSPKVRGENHIGV